MRAEPGPTRLNLGNRVPTSAEVGQNRAKFGPDRANFGECPPNVPSSNKIGRCLPNPAKLGTEFEKGKTTTVKFGRGLPCLAKFGPKPPKIGQNMATVSESGPNLGSQTKCSTTSGPAATTNILSSITVLFLNNRTCGGAHPSR